MIYQILDKAMKKAQGVQVLMSRSELTPVSFENDKLKSISVQQSTNISLKVIVNGKVGNSHTTHLSDIDSLVERALEAAGFGSKAYFEFPPPQSAVEVKVYDESVVNLSKEEQIKVCQEMVDLVKEYDPEILVSAGFDKSVAHIHFVNSAGVEFQTKSTRLSVGISGERIRGTDILYEWYGQSWRQAELDRINHKAIANRAIQKFHWAEKNAEIKSNKIPIIFTSNGTVLLLYSLELGVSGKSVFLGNSPLKGKLGERIAAERLTIIDNGLVDYATGSSKYDGEGIPRQITPLIEKGILKNFLYDLDAAGRAKTKSSGHGPGCEASNWLIAEGDVSFEDMLKDLKEGLIVDHVIGLGQGNAISGAFSVNVSGGYKVENGQIVGRVKNTMLAGNVYDALNNIIAIGNKAEWSGGSLKTPPIMVEGLSVVSN